MKIRNTLIALLSVFALGSMAPVEAHAARHHSSKKAVEAKSGKHAKAEKVSARSSRREKARHTAQAAPAVQRAAVASAGPVPLPSNRSRSAGSRDRRKGFTNTPRMPEAASPRSLARLPAGTRATRSA